jgi:hypothetical protein
MRAIPGLLTLALLVAFGGDLRAQNWNPCGSEWSEGMISRVTKKQGEKIADLRLACLREALPLRSAAIHMATETAALLAAPKPDLDAIKAKVGEMKAAEAAVLLHEARFVSEVKTLLDERQQRDVDVRLLFGAGLSSFVPGPGPVGSGVMDNRPGPGAGPGPGPGPGPGTGNGAGSGVPGERGAMASPEAGGTFVPTAPAVQTNAGQIRTKSDQTGRPRPSACDENLPPGCERGPRPED